MKMNLFSKTVVNFFIAVAAAAIFSSCQSADNAKTAATSSTKSSVEQKATSAALAASSDSSTQKVRPRQEQRKLIVYYLHGTFRCHSCNMIERLTREAVEQGFADQIKTGRVEMKVINIEESGNEHFVDDYKLYTKSVILSDLKDGKETRWKNLDQVWTLLGSDAKFVEYIQKEVKTWLEG